MQAAGTDERGRRQYRYHLDWRAYQNDLKFNRLETFGRALSRLRRQVEKDLQRNEPDLALVCAALIRLIDRAALRVGSEQYARVNGSFGATTLRSRHVRLDGHVLRLSYTAKGGRRVRKQIKDKTLARILDQLDSLPGQRLFSFVTDRGDMRFVSPDDINQYLSNAMREEDFTAKTFRTWHGTVAALNVAVNETDQLTIKLMSEAAADQLHNTASIARNSYIHPSVIDLAALSKRERHSKLDGLDLRRAPNALSKSEKRLIAFLCADQ